MRLRRKQIWTGYFCTIRPLKKKLALIAAFSGYFRLGRLLPVGSITPGFPDCYSPEKRNSGSRFRFADQRVNDENLSKRESGLMRSPLPGIALLVVRHAGCSPHSVPGASIPSIENFNAPMRMYSWHGRSPLALSIQRLFDQRDMRFVFVTKPNFYMAISQFVQIHSENIPVRTEAWVSLLIEWPKERAEREHEFLIRWIIEERRSLDIRRRSQNEAIISAADAFVESFVKELPKD